MHLDKARSGPPLYSEPRGTSGREGLREAIVTCARSPAPSADTTLTSVLAGTNWSDQDRKRKRLRDRV